MKRFDCYIPEAIRKKLKTTNDEELIKATKKHYLWEIEKWYAGSSIMENLSGYYHIPFGYHGTDPLAELADKLSLQEIYYHFTNILTCRQKIYLFRFETNKELIEKYRKNIIEKIPFSDYGQPIWDEKLTTTPKLWVCHKEDEKFNYVYFLFINSGIQMKFYDIITHEVKSIDAPGLIRCRMYLNKGIMEMAIRDFKFQDARQILNYLNKTVNLNPLSEINITDSDIRKFDQHSMVNKITHENRLGLDASTTLTRVTEDGDTRNDPFRADIEDRELRLEHGEIEVQGKKVIVTVKAGRYGSIRYHRFLLPEEQIAAFNKIKIIFGW
jgi:hypothetical protein